MTSTPDFDAAVERAAAAFFGVEAPVDLAWLALNDEAKDLYREGARAALQASGWEEAARLLREVVAKFDKNDSAVTMGPAITAARAWVAQYTPEAE